MPEGFFAMTQTVRRHDTGPAAVPDTAPQPPLIAFLRLASLACRAGPRGSIGACALLEPSSGPEDFAMALARALPEMLFRRPVLWRPGAAGQSFDEAWLLALSLARARNDLGSTRFLTRRRVRPEATPYLLLLLNGLAERLESTAA